MVCLFVVWALQAERDHERALDVTEDHRCIECNAPVPFYVRLCDECAAAWDCYLDGAE